MLILFPLFQVMAPSWIRRWVDPYCLLPLAPGGTAVLPYSSVPNSALGHFSYPTSRTDDVMYWCDDVMFFSIPGQVRKCQCHGEDVPQWRKCVSLTLLLYIPELCVAVTSFSIILGLKVYNIRKKNKPAAALYAHISLWTQPLWLCAKLSLPSTSLQIGHLSLRLSLQWTHSLKFSRHRF